MAEYHTLCEISEEVKAKLKKFRFRKEKNIAGIILKVNQNTGLIEEEEEYEDCTIEELQEELSEHQPRFLVISYVYDHGDGRVSYPLCFVYCCPPGGKPELNMKYASSKTNISKELNLTKVFEIRSSDELTTEWLEKKLKFFK